MNLKRFMDTVAKDSIRGKLNSNSRMQNKVIVTKSQRFPPEKETCLGIYISVCTKVGFSNIEILNFLCNLIRILCHKLVV